MQGYVTYNGKGTASVETLFDIGLLDEAKVEIVRAASENPGVVVAVGGDNLLATDETQRVFNVIAVDGIVSTQNFGV